MNRMGNQLRTTKRSRIHPVVGIRRKIRYGFIILGGLLLFSGMVSYFEFARLSRTTSEMLAGSVRDLEISQEMFDAATQQNDALLLKVSSAHADSLGADSLLRDGRIRFDQAFAEAEERNIHPARLMHITDAKRAYDGVLAQTPADSLAWYNQSYKMAYYDLALNVKDFMIDSQNTIDENTVRIQNNTYRAIMPGIITLGIAILIIFVFYVMIDFYYIRPLMKVKQGLFNFLNGKIPYHVQVDGRDEVRELSDDIATLVTLVRKKENNE
jgi:methyl-accepting chemotaxis protein